ncbi:phytase [Nonomuraea dietziae]|uniref:phytase n=1 Tax=Nonomuraea dietziae TaxID=65515 RepID=UPI003CD0A677
MSHDLPSVDPEVETPALFDDEAGHNANGDDPAIWLHPSQSGKSVVITTAKEGGLFVYDLDGRQLQHFPAPAGPRPRRRAGTVQQRRRHLRLRRARPRGRLRSRAGHPPDLRHLGRPPYRRDRPPRRRSCSTPPSRRSTRRRRRTA